MLKSTTYVKIHGYRGDSLKYDYPSERKLCTSYSPTNMAFSPWFTVQTSQFPFFSTSRQDFLQPESTLDAVGLTKFSSEQSQKKSLAICKQTPWIFICTDPSKNNWRNQSYLGPANQMTPVMGLWLHRIRH